MMTGSSTATDGLLHAEQGRDGPGGDLGVAGSAAGDLDADDALRRLADLVEHALELLAAPAARCGEGRGPVREDVEVEMHEHRVPVDGVGDVGAGVCAHDPRPL